MHAAAEGSARAPLPIDAAGERAALARDPAVGEGRACVPDAAAASPDLARPPALDARQAGAGGAGVAASCGTGTGGSGVEPRQGSSGARQGTGGPVRSSAGEAGDEVAPGIGSVAAAGSGNHIDEAGSSFTGRNASQPQMTILFRVPGYTAYMDDGSRVQFENIDHIVELNGTNGYTMCNLVADMANKTKWGTCQDPAFWYWDFEKNGMQMVVTNDDLSMVFLEILDLGQETHL